MSTIGCAVRGGRVAVAGLLVLAACGSGDDASEASRSSAVPITAADGSPAPTTAPPAVLPDGFDRGIARVAKSDGEVCEICVWRATSGDQRRQGLMGVTDLGPAVGMTFEYDELRDGWFWMQDTVMPLSIAFFDAEGDLVDAFDMEPCTDEPCERYYSDGRYRLAIEVPQGELASVGIGAGSRLELTDQPCPEP